MNEHEAYLERIALVTLHLPELFDGLGKTLLYVGASLERFQLGNELHAAGYEITLIEAFMLHVQHYIGHKCIARAVLCDVRNVIEMAAGERWDVSVWWHGPEHIKASELGWVLRDLESVTNDLVLLGCPWGHSNVDVVGGNLYSLHLNHLKTSDLEAFGYKTAALGRPNCQDLLSHIMAWKKIR